MMNTGNSCPVCGCAEVVKESGFFFCLECQSQREGMCEQMFEKQNDDDDDLEVLDMSFQGSRSQNQYGKRKKKTPQKKVEKLTSWECFNYVLRGQVNELIALGAPKSTKNIVFQMWSYYLHKLEAAFASEDCNALPKLNRSFKKGDAKLLYGLEKKKKERKKKEVISNLDLSTSLNNLNDWSSTRLKKRIKVQMKKAFLKEVSDVSVTGILGSQASLRDESEALDDTPNMEDTEDIDSSVQNVTITQLQKSHFNKVSLDLLQRKFKNCGDKDLQFLENLCGYSVNELSKMKLLIFLYLALLYSRSDIQVSDLLRWIREKRISCHDVAHFLPENLYLGPHSILNIHVVTGYGEFIRMSNEMTNMLGMDNWPVPDLTKLTLKYVQELQLPILFGNLILQVIQLNPNIFCCKYDKNSLPNYEGRVLALLIIILKLLFGLDGKTEHKISMVASKWNRWLEKQNIKKQKRLFVWNDWVRQIICRDAVLTKHYFPVKHVVCPEMFGNPEPFIHFWNKGSRHNQERKERGQSQNALLKDTQPTLMTYFSQVLEQLQDGTEADTNLTFPPSLTPYSDYIQTILKRCTASSSFLNTGVQNILGEDFTTCDINFLLKPSLLDKLAKKNNSVVEVRQKSAQKKFSRYVGEKPQKSRWLIHQSYVRVTHCSLKRKTYLNKEKVLGSFQFPLSRPETTSSIQKLLDEARKSLLSPKKRKRKTSSRSKSSKKKKSNILKLNLPYSQYWIVHENCTTERSFDPLFNKLSFSFSWLLSECALVSEMSNFVLYKEVIYLEKALKEFFESY